MEELNPEQTASLFSLVLYNFLDPIIFKAQRVSHIPPEESPPLADYDFSKNLVKKSFKVSYEGDELCTLVSFGRVALGFLRRSKTSSSFLWFNDSFW